MTNCCIRVAGSINFINFVHSSGKYSAILAATRHGGETLLASKKNKIVAKMKYIIIFIIFFVSCNEKKASLSIENKEKSWSKTFILENDSVNQTLFCNDPKNGKIEFAIAIENSKTHKIIKLNGFATTRNNFDGEVDEDQNGEAYFCQEYFYDDNLKIRLDSEEGNKARVVSNNNKEISSEVMKLR